MENVWNFLSNLVMWHIREARCVKIFEDNHVPEAGVVKEQLDIVEPYFMVCGQYDHIHGFSNEVLRHRLEFLIK